MPVVKIIAGHQVFFANPNNNGITRLEYDDQEFYEVPDHVARGMVARGWAKLMTSSDVAEQGPAPPRPPTREQPEPQPPQPEPDEDGDDDDDDDDDSDKPQEEGGHRQRALRTKKRGKAK